MNARARLKEFSFIAAIQVLAKFRTVILVPLMIRAFGIAQYGDWVQVIASTSLLCGVTQANLHTTLLRYLPMADGRRRAEVFYNGLLWVFGMSAIAGALVMFGLTALAARYLELPPALVFWLGPLVLVRSVFQFVNNVSRADGRVRAFTMIETGPAVTEIGAVALGAVFQLSLTTCLSAMVVMEAAFVLVLTGTIVRGMPLVRPTWSAMKPLLAYALPGIPTNVGVFALNFADRYVIGTMLGSAAVGAYSAAYALASIPSFLVRPLIVGLLPRASKAWDSGDKAGAVKMLRRSVKAYTFVGVPAAAGIAVVGPDILALTTGRTEVDWSVWLLLSIGAGTWLFGLMQLGIHSYLLEERVGATAWLYVGAAAVNIVLNVLLVPHLGLVAAGLATTIAYGAACLPVQLNTLRRIGPVFEIRSTAVALVSAAAMGAVAWFVRAPTIPRVALAVAAGAVVYPVLAFALRYFDAEERRYLLDAVRRRGKKAAPGAPTVESAEPPT